MPPVSQDALKRKKAHSTLNIRIQVSGTPIGNGRLQSMNADHDFGLTPVHGIGDFEPEEHMPTRYDGTLTLDAFRIRKQDLIDLGIGAVGAAILEMDVLEVQVLDTISNTVIREYQRCSIGRYSERFQEGAICGENATLKVGRTKNTKVAA